MKMLTMMALLFGITSTQLNAGGVPSPKPTVKKVIELNSKSITVSPDFSLNGINGAQNIGITALNRNLDDNVEEFRERLIRAFHTRHSGAPGKTPFSFIAVDHPFFSMVSIILQDFDYKNMRNLVMNHMFTHKLPLTVNMDFFDQRLKSSLANIFIPRKDPSLSERILEKVITTKGKVQLILKSNLVYASGRANKCLVTVQSHFNLLDLEGRTIVTENNRTFDFGLQTNLSPEIEKECVSLGLEL